MKRLLSYLKPYSLKLGAAIFLIIVVAGLNAYSPLLEGQITSSLFADVAAQTAVNFKRIYQIVVVLIIVQAGNGGGNLLYQFLLTDAIQGAMVGLRDDISKKMKRMPISYFDQHPLGDILSRVTNDVESISNALQQSFAQIFNAVLTIVLAITLMIRINWKLAMVAISVIVFSCLASYIIAKRSQALFNQQQSALGDLLGLVQEKYTGFSEIKLFGKQDETIEVIHKANSELCETGFRATFFSGLMSPAVSLFTYLGIGTIGVAGALLVMGGSILVGDLQAFVRYIWQINNPLSQISQLSGALQSAVSATRRVFEFLDEEEEVVEPASPMAISHQEGNVTFENVCFHYDKKVPLLNGVNAEVKTGQMVAIVGPTGVGKTTLINLLMRFYDVVDGSIKINGVDLRDAKRDEVRSMFGMVLQDTWLFKGTIKENIAYGKEGATDEEIIAAAKIANVHHAIKTLPNGYNMVINEEGNNISQGEKQLLTIARAVLCDPPIMILDEATSSVDTRLEQILQEAMHRIMEGRTSFVIAHRLSTIRKADLILVMQDGNIVEQGNHEQLLEQKGYYEQLYYAQFSEKKGI